MISSLQGTVLHSTSDQIVVDVGGVGFAVSVPVDLAHTASIGERIALHTSLVVREDALSLYGFAQRDELEVFGLLIGVTGVGPKSALGVLSHLTVDQIASAVTDEDDAPFRRVSGIGPKTAKLIVVQLAGKVHASSIAPAPSVVSSSGAVVSQVVAALVGLGWSEKVAAEAVTRAEAEAPDAERAAVAPLLRRTLAMLGPARV